MSFRNFKLRISYDGSRYFGFERQPDKETIQGKLEAVLSRMCEPEKIEVIGAGRTDAGVHAEAMVVHTFLPDHLQPEEIASYMNRYLPDDISVDEVRPASDRFHARYNAIGKTYRYTCYIGEKRPVFRRKYVTLLSVQPDVEKMKEAAGHLVGTHDFKSFCGNPKMKKSTVRTIDQLQIRQSKGYLTFLIHGNGFLQHMVRIVVGTLLEVGEGKYPPDRVREILEAKDRRLAGPTAEAGGLCLVKVDYM